MYVYCIMYMYKKYFYCGPPHAAYTCGCEKVYGVAVCFFSLVFFYLSNNTTTTAAADAPTQRLYNST